MKKYLIPLLLTVAAFVACDEIIAVNEGTAIKFDSISTDGNYDSYDVYGIVNDGVSTHNIFSGEETECRWKIGAEYAFAALINGDVPNVSALTLDADGMPLSIAYTADGATDIVYAYTHYGVYTQQNTSVVVLNFNHMLSKVKFAFTNGFDELTGIDVAVRDVAITNAAVAGTLRFDGEAAAWTPEKDVTTLSFGNEGVNTQLLIPETKQWNITFTVDLVLEGEVVASFPQEVTTTPFTLAPGHSYDFTAEISGTTAQLNPIAFAAESITGTITPLGDDTIATDGQIQQ